MPRTSSRKGRDKRDEEIVKLYSEATSHKSELVYDLAYKYDITQQRVYQILKRAKINTP